VVHKFLPEVAEISYLRTLSYTHVASRMRMD